MDKKRLYDELCQQLEALLSDEHDPIAIMANTGAMLYQYLDHINWAGFYRFVQGELCLGPFQGKIACMHIPYGKGVCGTCLKEETVVRVDDVRAFSGHIACDSVSQSEIVLPLYKDGNFFAVLDIDSPLLQRFDEQDEAGLTKIKHILENAWKCQP